jgi:phosphatidylglycerophosphate synthase
MDQEVYQPTERRPIKARGWWVNEKAAAWLALRGVTANSISIIGMVAGILAGIALAVVGQGETHRRLAWLLGAVFIQLRLLANLLDGMVAIESKKASRVGELYNEIPDRVSDTATIVGAGIAANQLSLGLAAACVAVFTAYVRAAGKAAGAPHQYCGPMAKPHRMALLTVISVYHALTPIAWQLRTDAGEPMLVIVGLWIIVVGGLITAIRRIAKIAAFLKAASGSTGTSAS